MVHYLEVPKTPSIIFTTPYNRRASLRQQSNARTLIDGFYSTSARDSRDFANHSGYTRRSRSDFAIPRLYRHSSTPSDVVSVSVHAEDDVDVDADADARRLSSACGNASTIHSLTSSSSMYTTHRASSFNKSPDYHRHEITIDKGQIAEILQIVLAEVLGTALLLFVGCAPVNTFMPWTFGFAFSAAIQAFSPVSGCHINPAVSIAATVMGRMKNPYLLPVYVISQFIGAFIGYSLHYYLVLTSFPGSEKTCVTKPPENISEIQCCLLEMIMTFWFLIGICAYWDPHNEHTNDAPSIKFGLILSGLLYSMHGVIPLSLNTARSLPPSVFNNDFRGHWIYWIGPNIGGLFAGCVYRFLLYPRPHKIEEDLNKS